MEKEEEQEESGAKYIGRGSWAWGVVTGSSHSRALHFVGLFLGSVESLWTEAVL